MTIRLSCWSRHGKSNGSGSGGSRTVIKIGFIIMLISDAVWLTPAGFVATGSDMPDDMKLPEGWENTRRSGHATEDTRSRGNE